MFNKENRFIFTLSIGIIGLLLCLLSFFSERNGNGELYPFFSWQLFSVAYLEKDLDDTLFTHRIYFKEKNEANWIRVKKTNRPGGINHENQIPKFIKSNYRDNSFLNEIRKIVSPDADSIKLVRESYQLRSLIQNPDEYAIEDLFYFEK